MGISKGNWTVGRTGGSVVTDNGEGFSETSGHGSVDFYGGYLIAESILKKADAEAIATVPEMIKVCQKVVDVYKMGTYKHDKHDLFEMAWQVLRKSNNLK